MYWEAGTRCSIYFKTRNAPIQHLPHSQVCIHPVFGPKVQKVRWAQEQGYKYTQVYIGCLWDRKIGRLQGRRKTFRGGAATSKKHAYVREVTEKFISTLCGHPLKTQPRIYIHGNYGGVDWAYSQKLRPGGSKTALVGLLYRYWMRRIRPWARGSGYMLPQENV